MIAKTVDLFILAYHIVFEILWVLRRKLYIAYSFGSFPGQARSLWFGDPTKVRWSMDDGEYQDRAALLVFRWFKFVGDLLWRPGSKKPLNQGWWAAYTAWLPEDVSNAMHHYYGLKGENTVLYVDTGQYSRDIPIEVSVIEVGPDECPENALGYRVGKYDDWCVLSLREEIRVTSFDRNLFGNLKYYTFLTSGK